MELITSKSNSSLTSTIAGRNNMKKRIPMAGNNVRVSSATASSNSEVKSVSLSPLTGSIIGNVNMLDIEKNYNPFKTSILPQRTPDALTFFL